MSCYIEVYVHFFSLGLLSLLDDGIVSRSVTRLSVYCIGYIVSTILKNKQTKLNLLLQYIYNLIAQLEYRIRSVDELRE